MPRRRSLSSTAREQLYDRCRGSEPCPRCNIPGCGAFVLPGQRWVESHFPSPHALGGVETGIAHFHCNAAYAAAVEAPLIAKVKRQRRRHIGARMPRHPLPCGRDSPLKIKIGGGLAPRLTLSQRLKALAEKRSFHG